MNQNLQLFMKQNKKKKNEKAKEGEDIELNPKYVLAAQIINGNFVKILER